ncbi:MAG TPA: ABC transporter substrate-binding protein [Thermomicrobiales bacterium]|nr:ABC transporter substrate-binding protein [Thermomicrobiales bacterium]
MKRQAGLIIAALLVAAGCSSTPGSSAPASASGSPPAASAAVQDGGTIKVGFVGNLTGQIANIGQDALNASQLAADTVNAQGGIVVGGKRYTITVVSEDEGSQVNDPGTAVSAVNRLISGDVDAIVGGVVTSNVLAFMPVTQSAGVPLIDTIGRGQSIIDGIAKDKLDTVFVASATTRDAAAGIAGAMKNLIAPTKVAYILVDTDATHGLLADIQAANAAAGLTVQEQVTFVPQGTTDFASYILKIKDFAPDVIYADVVGGSLAWARQLSQSGYTTGYVVIGDAEYVQADFLSQASTEANLSLVVSVTVPSSVTPVAEAFYKDYAAKFGAPASNYAVQQYDGMLALFEGIRRSGGLTGDVAADRAAIVKGLAQITEAAPFVGIRSGTAFFSSLETGHKMPANAVITQIQDGKFVPVWPADVAQAAGGTFIDPRK